MKQLADAQPPPQTRSLGELNMRLKKMKEERTRMAQVGAQAVQFNYKNLTSKIPTQAMGAIGAKYYEHELKPGARRDPLTIGEDDITAAAAAGAAYGGGLAFGNEEARAVSAAGRALYNLKKKMKREELRAGGVPINDKKRPSSVQSEFDQPLAELFDVPNPHYRKLFDPGVLYRLGDDDGDSDDGGADPLEREQREQMQAAFLLHDQKQAKKLSLLQRVNQNVKLRQEVALNEQSHLNRIARRDESIKSIMKKNTHSLSATRPDDAKKPKQIIRIAGREYEQPTEKVLRFEDDLAGGDLQKLPKWKLKSEAFRAALRSANKGLAVNDTENQIILDALNNNALVKCPHCGRRFNERAAEKHIAHCYDKMLTDKIKTQRRKKTSLQI